MAHNRVISTQATPWLKKSILRRLFVKYYYRFVGAGVELVRKK